MDRREILKGAVEGLVLAAAGNAVFAAENANQQVTAHDKISSENAARSVFTPSSAGAVVTTVQRKLREGISVLDFGASPAAAATNVKAFQSALSYANAIGGARVSIPAGTYSLNATLNIYKNTTLEGDGRTISVLVFSHMGDGINSTWPINSSTAANIKIRNTGLTCTNRSNAGGGFVDVGGSFIFIENCRFSGWKYNVIFDQTELAVMRDSETTSWIAAGMWLVNGADHTAGANRNFTNRVTIEGNQFNASGGICLQDDGGANHSILNNNFQSGKNQIRASGVAGLTILNNEMEGASSYPIYLAETNPGGTYIGPCIGFDINGNTISAGRYNIYLDQASAGSIVNNTFYQYATAAIGYNFGRNARISGIRVGNNAKVICGAGITSGPFFDVGQIATWKNQSNIAGQYPATYVSAPQSAGLNTVIPSVMELINIGGQLLAINVDGSAPEVITVTAVTASTFTAAFANAKAANYLLYGIPGAQSGTYSPLLQGGSLAGTGIYSKQYGEWTLNGNKVSFFASIVWTAHTGNGQMRISLPFQAKASEQYVPLAVNLTGPAAIFSGQLYAMTYPGTSVAGLGYVSASSGNPSPIALATATSGSVNVSGSYEIY